MSEKQPTAPDEEYEATFWVIERIVDGRSFGYWHGNSSREFTRVIENAVQFHRKSDADKIMLSWHWKDVIATEHKYLSLRQQQPTAQPDAERVSGFDEWFDNKRVHGMPSIPWQSNQDEVKAQIWRIAQEAWEAARSTSHLSAEDANRIKPSKTRTDEPIK